MLYKNTSKESPGTCSRQQIRIRRQSMSLYLLKKGEGAFGSYLTKASIASYSGRPNWSKVAARACIHPAKFKLGESCEFCGL